MSTFKGIIAEFPQIRIDYFRQQPGFQAPLACFLSHVHSDHRVGLETHRAPFIYCSAATREILLRLEKYQHRINFAKGILESRNVTYDRSMRKLVKPLPLNTPTKLELSPGNSIRVTLVDANHCVGAVMFLIEKDGTAVLYTGDIRAETWWVNSLVRNPVILPYTLGNRRLKCLYLDTTFATKNEPYRKFPSKAQGLQELLDKVGKYPDDTVFYFHSWTFGYEDVWIALSAFLQSQIHLDDYRARIYGSLSTLNKTQLQEIGLNVQADNKFLRDAAFEVQEATALCGFRNGNHTQPGCLTSRENVRIHSCEPGMGCRVMNDDTESDVVHIIPIVTRSNGTDIVEVGAGGGKGDLDQKEELETGDAVEVGKLMELCAMNIEDGNILCRVLKLLQRTLAGGDSRLVLDIQLQKDSEDSQGRLSVPSLVSSLSANASKSLAIEEPQSRTIRFPYSRHSSYSELCGLVSAFRPNDIYPCTVDEERWEPNLSIQSLFGEFCSATIFRHDAEMTQLYEAKMRRNVKEKRRQTDVQEDTQAAEESTHSGLASTAYFQEMNIASMSKLDHANLATPTTMPNDVKSKAGGNERVSMLDRPSKQRRTEPIPIPPSCPRKVNQEKDIPQLTHRQIAYEAAIGTQLTWSDYGGLTSTRRQADREEIEL